MMSRKILVIEDDLEISELLKLALVSKGYQVIIAHDGSSGFEQYKKTAPDLIITDAMMPNIDGYSFVKIIRVEDKTIPIIMLTALKSEEDELSGFDAGVNDYVSKLFSLDVLVHRIEAQLRLATIDEEEMGPTEITDGRIMIDLNRYLVYVDGEKLRLTNKEYSLLVYLVENKLRVLTREELAKCLWGENYYGDTRNIDTHIKNLRKKINFECIKTIKGIGYLYEQ